jgi:DcuC family C4-dicarboxylate transporter
MLFAAETAAWQQLLGLVVIALAVWAIVRELEVRLVLIVAALALGLLAWNPQAIVREFFQTFTNEKFIIPLCCGMGFAHVLKHTECDQHLVHLLVKPLSKVHALLVPGTIIVGFLVNMPIVSQSSTAVAIGAVIIPILRAARLAPATIGAALLLGCSIGGELLNPGAPELQTTVTESEKAAKQINYTIVTTGTIGRLAMDSGPLGTAVNLHPRAFELHDPRAFDHRLCVQRIVPFNLLGLFVATLVFWVQSVRSDTLQDETQPAVDPSNPTPVFRVNWLKAAVPILPIAFLYLSSYPFELLKPSPAWLETPGPDGRPSAIFNTRLIGLAMMLGVVAAALVTPSKVKGIATAFFEGAGFGFGHIVSLIVVANCFGKGITDIGLAEGLGQFIQDNPTTLVPAAGALALGFAALSGSGMATAQSLFGFFARPSLMLGIDPTHVGAVVSLAAAAGRTMSPVAAVTLMCARMTDTKPLELAKRVAVPLLIAVAVIIIVAMIWIPAV